MKGNIRSPYSNMRYISLISESASKLSMINYEFLKSVDSKYIHNTHVDMMMAKSTIPDTRRWAKDILQHVDDMPDHMIKFVSPIIKYECNMDEYFVKHHVAENIPKLLSRIMVSRCRTNFMDWFISDDIIDDAIENYGLAPCTSSDESEIFLYEESILSTYARMLVNNIEYQLAIIFDSADYDDIRFLEYDCSDGVVYQRGNIVGAEALPVYGDSSDFIYMPYIDDTIYSVLESSVGLNIYKDTFIAISGVVRCDMLRSLETFIHDALTETNEMDYLMISDTVVDKIVSHTIKILHDKIYKGGK